MKIEHIKTGEQLGVAIKRARKKMGLSQTELSKMINMRQPTISDIENGSGTMDSVFKIIQAMGLSLSLNTGSEAKNSNKEINEMLNLIKD